MKDWENEKRKVTSLFFKIPKEKRSHERVQKGYIKKAAKVKRERKENLPKCSTVEYRGTLKENEIHEERERDKTYFRSKKIACKNLRLRKY